MNVDRYGLPVTTESAEALERYQDGMDRLLSYGPDAEERFAAATAADEGLALAHAGTALLAFFQGEGDAARAAIGRAARLVSGASRRERQHVEALSTMIGGDTARGLALIEEHVGDFPRDALLVTTPTAIPSRAPWRCPRFAASRRSPPVIWPARWPTSSRSRERSIAWVAATRSGSSSRRPWWCAI